MIRRPFADWVERHVENGGWVVIPLGYLLFDGVVNALAGYWFPLEFAGGLTLVVVIWRGVVWDRWRQWERVERMRANHICLHCGYDMRATPERCSECGRWADEPVEG